MQPCSVGEVALQLCSTECGLQSLCIAEDIITDPGLAKGVTPSPCSSLDLTMPGSTLNVALPPCSIEDVVLPPCSTEDIARPSVSLLCGGHRSPFLLYLECCSPLWLHGGRRSPSGSLEIVAPPMTLWSTLLPPLAPWRSSLPLCYGGHLFPLWLHGGCRYPLWLRGDHQSLYGSMEDIAFPFVFADVTPPLAPPRSLLPHWLCGGGRFTLMLCLEPHATSQTYRGYCSASYPERGRCVSCSLCEG